MSRLAVKPYLVAKQAEGDFRITVRTTRFNSQGYPLVTAEVLPDSFRTATLARTYIRENYRADAADIVTQAKAV